MMDRFSKLNPFVHTAFFLLVFVLVLSVYHPIFSAVSLLFAVLYGIRLRGREILSSIKFVFVILVVVSVFNMLFAHYGEDILFSVKDVDFTLEALFYGFNQGMVLASVMLWFGAFSRLADSERVVYVLRHTPKIALIFSMVLGFIPRFSRKMVDIREAQIALNGGENTGSKMRRAVDNFSALVSYSLESSIITSDSMTACGYNPRAIRHGRYKLAAGDIACLCLIILLAVFYFVERARGNVLFIFDPFISNEAFSPIAFVSYTVIMALPVIIDLWEDLLWKASSVKN